MARPASSPKYRVSAMSSAKPAAFLASVASHPSPCATATSGFSFPSGTPMHTITVSGPRMLVVRHRARRVWCFEFRLGVSIDSATHSMPSVAPRHRCTW